VGKKYTPAGVLDHLIQGYRLLNPNKQGKTGIHPDYVLKKLPALKYKKQVHRPFVSLTRAIRLR
jgi:hypothetical protein